ncbi:MAG: SUMF1/EgtB/PvdO family nonheme iron enzyme [Polyangiaceae bacterium]|nr:SUMF1/EgtB/PvdO family nonheme iron enzyme [Polyangiaceae bacterium]
MGCSSLIGLDEFKPDLGTGGAGGSSAGIGNTGGGGTGTGNTGGGGTGNAGNGTGNTTSGGAGNASGVAGNTGSGGAGNGGGGTGGGGTGNTGTGASGGTESGSGCPSTLKGPAMSRVHLPNDDYFCIDTTEVTNAQYEEFVTFGDLKGQPTVCSFNQTYEPALSDTCTLLINYDPGNKPTYPVACVDWCDVCQWAGKRLCGAVAGGSTPASSRANPNIDQWHNACTLGGSRTYPYGNTYTEGRCNDLTAATSGPFPVGGFPQCFGNHPGEAPVYDMSGDLQEWEDSCSGNSCAARGGDWLGYEGTAACAQTDTANRDVRDHHRGFRCCWDPPN